MRRAAPLPNSVRVSAVIFSLVMLGSSGVSTCRGGAPGRETPTNTERREQQGARREPALSITESLCQWGSLAEATGRVYGRAALRENRRRPWRQRGRRALM